MQFNKNEYKKEFNKYIKDKTIKKSNEIERGRIGKVI